MRQEYPLNNEHLCDCHYHHSGKGCEMEARFDSKLTLGSNANIEYWYCRTHNLYCSKTGWELHWYNGTNTRDLRVQRFRRRCRKCGEWLETNTRDNKYICQNCENTNEK